MSKPIRFAWIPALLGLSACDVQVRDDTPAEYPANHDIGMYEIKASTQAGSLVSPGSVFVFGLGSRQRIELTPNRAGTEWHGLYPVRCRSSFPLQFQTVWKLQGLTTRQKLVPEKPREVKLVPPPPSRDTVIDTVAGKKVKPPKGGWQGAVSFRFVTAQDTKITAAHIEPSSQEAADVAAAKAISLVDSMPVDAPCGTPTEVHLASTAQEAHGTLVIDTDDPGVPHAQTKVRFQPPAK